MYEFYIHPFISVEAVEIKGSDTPMELVEVRWRLVQVEADCGSDGISTGHKIYRDRLVEAMEFYRVTKFTDTSWWKRWNFTGSQNILIPVGGSHVILPGHKIY